MKPQALIERLSFNDGTELKIGHSDIVIFTGANNAGKSQVLKDIDMMMGRNGTKGIVSTSLEMRYTGDIREIIDDYKTKDGGYKICGDFFDDPESIELYWANSGYGFIDIFKNHLTTGNRLRASIDARSFDTLREEPYEPVHKLYLDDKLEEKISNLFHEAFNEYLIVNRGGGSTIPIHVGQPPVKAAGEDRVSAGYLAKLRNLPTLQSQGDGMRSFAAILLDVFTSQRTITLIDEPEAFLHPPQARLLGRMLVKNKPNDRQLFISTHSEDFLKGLLDADTDNVKIVRINREGDVNYIKVLDNHGVRNLWKDSILRYSNILSGLFHSKVVICESDTDCRFYQAVLDALYEGKDVVSPDILFTHSNGKERLKVVIAALKSLNVKVVVISDIDVLDKEATFNTICNEIGVDFHCINGKWKTVNEYVRSQREQLNTEEVKKDIIAILDRITTPDFPKEGVEQIKNKLKASTAWAKVKRIGKTFFSGSVYADLNVLMNTCKMSGLFIVPVGELESFYKPAENKHATAWLDIVLKKDLANDMELEEARKFVGEMVGY